MSKSLKELIEAVTTYKTPDGCEFTSFGAAWNYMENSVFFDTSKRCTPGNYLLIKVESNVEDTFNKKITAIKDVRSVFYCGLLSAKEFVEHAAGKFDEFGTGYPSGYRKATFRMTQLQYDALVRTKSFTDSEYSWNRFTQILLRVTHPEY